jgi:hypothetical protein
MTSHVGRSVAGSGSRMRYLSSGSMDNIEHDHLRASRYAYETHQQLFAPPLVLACIALKDGYAYAAWKHNICRGWLVQCPASNATAVTPCPQSAAAVQPPEHVRRCRGQRAPRPRPRQPDHVVCWRRLPPGLLPRSV